MAGIVRRRDTVFAMDQGPARREQAGMTLNSLSALVSASTFYWTNPIRCQLARESGGCRAFCGQPPRALSSAEKRRMYLQGQAENNYHKRLKDV